MAFTPTAPGSMPTPDEVLAQLQPESSDPDQSKGYITPDDIAFAWQVFLSRLAHHDDALTALQAAQTALASRVTAVEQGAGSGPGGATPFAETTAAEAALPAVGVAGTLLLALDTGQWFRSEGSAWQRIGLDTTATGTNLGTLGTRADWTDQVLAGIVGDTMIDPWTTQGSFQPGDVVLQNGALYVATAASQGAAPATAADKWSVLSLPDVLAKVKQALATQGASGALPPPSDPADDGKVLTARHGAGVWETLAALTAEKVLGTAERAWSAVQAYSEHDVVLHQGHYWIARAATSAGDEPGVDAKWRALTLPDLWLAARPGALDNLSDVTAPDTTPAGKVLGTTAVGVWGPVDLPSGGGGGMPADVSAVPAWDTANAYHPGDAVTNGGTVYIARAYVAPNSPAPDVMGPSARWAPFDGLVAEQAAERTLGDLRMAVGTTSWLGEQFEWWTAKGYGMGMIVRYSNANGSQAGFYKAAESTTAADVPGASKKWVRISLSTLANMNLGGLANVDSPWDTPVGKVLGTTGQNQWGPVDPFWTGTQAEYDAIAVKDPHRLYVVTG